MKTGEAEDQAADAVGDVWPPAPRPEAAPDAPGPEPSSARRAGYGWLAVPYVLGIGLSMIGFRLLVSTGHLNAVNFTVFVCATPVIAGYTFAALSRWTRLPLLWRVPHTLLLSVIYAYALQAAVGVRQSLSQHRNATLGAFVLVMAGIGLESTVRHIFGRLRERNQSHSSEGITP